MRAAWPGIVIPPAGASTRERLESAFASSGPDVERQAKALSAFLGRLTAHPLLRETPDLAVFLEGGGDAWAAALAWYERGPVVAAAGALNAFFARVTSQADSMLAAASAPPAQLAAEDHTYLEGVRYLLATEELLTQLVAQAQALAAAATDGAEACRAVDVAASSLGRGVLDRAGGEGGAPAGEGGLGEALLQASLLARQRVSHLVSQG